MITSEETVKKFFSSEINSCSRISIRIDMRELTKDIYVEKPDVISYVWAFNQYIEKNKSWLSSGESYFLSWKLANISPILKERDVDFRKFLGEINCSYRNNELKLFEEDDLFFLSIKQEDSTLFIDVYYLLENTILENMKKDLSKFQTNTSNLFYFEFKDSFDTNYNSHILLLLIKKYSYIFSKQDTETKYLINEIQHLFFEGFSENSKGKLIATIALISIIIEDNLIKMYKKSENKRPNEGYNINLLNDIIAKNEIVELRLSFGGYYQILSKNGSTTPVLYKKDSKIYLLINDYARTIRNKVLHFQQSVTLDLFYTSVHAIKYLVSILMEIENNGYL